MRTWEARERALAAALAHIADGLDTHDIGPNDDAQGEMLEEALMDAVVLYAACIVRDRLKNSAEGQSLVASHLRELEAKGLVVSGPAAEEVFGQIETMEFALREITQIPVPQGSKAVELAIGALPAP